MEKSIRNLWVKALSGSSAAYRKLGCLFMQGRICKKDMLLAKLCLNQAAEMGDEQGYLLYHKFFYTKGKIIDDLSYEDMCKEYRETKSRRKKKWLKKYLEVAKKERREPLRIPFL